MTVMLAMSMPTELNNAWYKRRLIIARGSSLRNDTLRQTEIPVIFKLSGTSDANGTFAS